MTSEAVHLLDDVLEVLRSEPTVSTLWRIEEKVRQARGMVAPPEPAKVGDTITTEAELDLLPIAAIVRDSVAWERYGRARHGWHSTQPGQRTGDTPLLPVVVLYLPEESE